MGVWKNCVMAYIGGVAYVLLELAWRGWSHPSMFVVGGLCFVLVGGLNGGLLRWEMPLEVQTLLGAGMITAVELGSGIVLNLWLKLNVWDYSAFPLNFLGQICLECCMLWVVLSFLAVFADDWLRYALFGERRPAYTLLFTARRSAHRRGDA